MALQKQNCMGNWIDIENDRVGEYIKYAANYSTVEADVIMGALYDNQSCRIGTDWYEKIRIEPAPIYRKPEDTVMCACGHRCPKSLVMVASLGRTCPDCYDDFSD